MEKPGKRRPWKSLCDFHFSHSFNNNKLDDPDHFLENPSASVATLRRLIGLARNTDRDRNGMLIGFNGIPSNLLNEEQAMLSIRSGTPNDVPLLKTFFEEFATYERLSTVITEAQLRQDGFGPRPRFRVLIAEMDGSPAGYALFFDCYSSLLGHGIFLEDLFVRPQFRGKSVGRALFAHVARITEDADGFGIMFDVLDWNTRAIEFYRRIGATFLDDWKTVCLKQKALHDLASEV